MNISIANRFATILCMSTTAVLAQVVSPAVCDKVLIARMHWLTCTTNQDCSGEFDLWINGYWCNTDPEDPAATVKNCGGAELGTSWILRYQGGDCYNGHCVPKNGQAPIEQIEITIIHYPNIEYCNSQGGGQ